MTNRKGEKNVRCLVIAIMEKEVYLIKLKRTTLSNKVTDHHVTRI